MEWRVHPVTCPTVARAANAGVQLDTVANIMEAELLVAALDSYLMYMRGSAIVWHAYLLKVQDFRKEFVVDPKTED
ncbi:hypothetical protein CYMTET_55358 [Cymbomonas tetramitiformis]|uniref:Uncharacterized protein n=1 Tax=Cymbomonas tetramitiformis TaxID=36881 RepID=A0AAE0BD76_9CHLO|nr:hypothetical protein CYMTET_55358 [Cymbomonas tetramitiformis]